MKPRWLGVLVACSPEGSGRIEPPAPVVRDEARQSIDVSSTGVPVTIRGVEVVPRPDHSLEVTYRVDAKGPALVPARTMCRVGDRNVVYPMTVAGKVAGPRLASLYRPDPFNQAPHACEVLFFYAPDERTPWRDTGRACWQGGKLRDGACPADSFPPPVLPTAGGVVLEKAALELHDSTAVVTALYTLALPLERDRRLLASISCDDATGKTSGQAAFTFLPLEEIPPGSSVFGPLTIPLERTPAADASCSLDIFSRVRVADSSGGRRIHAQYCLTAHTVRAGGC